MAQDSGASLEEIVVTARKRDESALDVPISVAAFSSADIEVRGIVSLQDVAAGTPGMNISNVNSGRSDRSFQQITLRGFTPSTTSSTLTATFIDGVPVSSATAISNVVDPERIEILRGPQSAYFGRNSFAGAVNVVNKRPGEEFGGDINVMVGNYSNIDARGSVEGRLFSDKAGFRITARQWSKDGTYDNQAVPGQTLGDQETTSVSLYLDAEPTENFTAKFYALASWNSDGPSAEGLVSAYELRSNGGFPNAPFNSGNNDGTLLIPSQSNCTLAGRPFICGAAPGLNRNFSPGANTAVTPAIAAALANGAGRVVSPSDGPDGYGLEGGYNHYHLTLDYQFGDSGFSLTSLTGYNDEYISELDDLDNYNSTALLGGWTFPFLVERDNKDFSQEFRLNYDNGGPLSGVVGVSYLKSESRGSLVSVFAETVFGAPRNPLSATAPQEADTTGVFFGLNYNVNDRLTLTAEGRWQEDEVFAFSRGPVTLPDNNSFGLPGGTVPAYSEFFSNKFTEFLPRVIGQYDINDDLMVYASWSEGVNVGLASFNTNFLGGSPAELAAAETIGLGVVVQPEKLTNIEFGLKGTFLDGRLQGSLVYYTADWDDQINQRSAFFQDDPAPIGTGSVETIAGSVNSGEVKVSGVELDLLASLSDNIKLNFASAINDSDIRTFIDPQITLTTGLEGDDYRGNQLPLSSKYSANLGIQYDGDLTSMADAAWFARADISYKSKQFVDAANQTWIDSRTQVNLRAGITRGAWKVDAFVLNAFDNDDYISPAQNVLLDPFFQLVGPFRYLNVGLPTLRTYGVQFGYNF
ncbi:MAG: TonB-dependent receptor [Lysobacterales bacterium]